MTNSATNSIETYRKRLRDRPEVATVFGREDVARTPEPEQPQIHIQSTDGTYVVPIELEIDTIVSLLNCDVAQDADDHSVYLPTKKVARTLYEKLLGCVCMFETHIEIYHEADGGFSRFQPPLAAECTTKRAAKQFLTQYTTEEAGETIDRQPAIKRFAQWLRNRRMAQNLNLPMAAKAFETVAQTEQPDTGVNRVISDRRWCIEDTR